MAITVLVTMLASVTFVPAMLGFIGTNIDKFRIPWLHRERTHGPGDPLVPVEPGRASRPWAAGSAGLLALLILMVPFFSLRLGFSDAGNNASSDTTRRAYDFLSDGFGDGFNGPLVLAAHSPDGVEGLDPLRDALSRTRGVESVGPAVASPEDEQTAVISGLPDDLAPKRSDRAARRPTPRRCDPRGDRGNGCHGRRRRAHGRVGRHHRQGPRPAPRLHRRRAGAEFPRADAGLPLTPRSAEGRGDEHPVDCRGLRGVCRRLPVGLVRGALGNRGHRADRTVRADDDVRHRVRAVDGLRSVPALADSGGVRPHRRQQPRGSGRSRCHRPGDHRGGGDHDHGVRKLCVRRAASS